MGLFRSSITDEILTKEQTMTYVDEELDEAIYDFNVVTAEDYSEALFHLEELIAMIDVIKEWSEHSMPCLTPSKRFLKSCETFAVAAGGQLAVEAYNRFEVIIPRPEIEPIEASEEDSKVFISQAIKIAENLCDSVEHMEEEDYGNSEELSFLTPTEKLLAISNVLRASLACVILDETGYTLETQDETATLPKPPSKLDARFPQGNGYV